MMPFESLFDTRLFSHEVTGRIHRGETRSIGNPAPSKMGPQIVAANLEIRLTAPESGQTAVSPSGANAECVVCFYH